MSYIKLYWKLIKASRSSLIIYSGVFILVFVIYAGFLGKSSSTSIFQDVKPDIVLVDHDHSEASKALQSYIAEVAAIQDVKEGKSDREDALFYGFVSNIVEIPEGFEDAFLSGKDTNILCTSRPQEANASLLEMKIESYLSSMSIYHKSDPSLSIAQLHESAFDRATEKLDIQVQNEETVSASQRFRGSFFNYLSYIMMALMLMSVGMTMTMIFKSDIQKRNTMAPVSSNHRNICLFAANVLFGIFLWSVFSIVICFLPNSDMFTLHGAMYLLNSFVFTMLCVALGFMFSCILSNKRNASEALSGITNVVSLGGAFLGGAFVPQSMLSSSVLMASGFLPTYWFVKANDTLVQVVAVTQDTMQTFFSCLGIQCLFMITFILIALVIMRNRKSQNSYLNAKEQYK